MTVHLDVCPGAFCLFKGPDPSGDLEETHRPDKIVIQAKVTKLEALQANSDSRWSLVVSG